MDRMIHTLNEQHYYTTKICKSNKKIIKVLDKNKLIISETQMHKDNNVYYVTHRVKNDFSKLYEQFDIFLLSKVQVSFNKEIPDKIVVDPSPTCTLFSFHDKNGKLIETSQMTHYGENIRTMMHAQSDLINVEFTQVGFITSPPIKFILQPIVLYDNEFPAEMINVVISLYDDGFLIIDFDFIFSNVPFSNLQNFEDPEDKEYYMNRKCLVPNIVLNENSREPNLYNKNKITVSESIGYYLKYITNLFGDSVDNRSNEAYKNYSLINYDGEPENFNSVSSDLRVDLYWIVNMPRGITEQSKGVYDKFISNYYEINKNVALYLSTVERSIVVTTKDKLKLNTDNLSFKSQMFSMRSYIDPIIRICLIKKKYYHDIWNFKTPYNDGDLREKERKIYKNKDKLNRITLMSYGSARRCLEYYEQNMVDFLNYRQVDEVLSSYKNLKYLEMTQENEKSNRRLNIFLLLFTIVFSYDPLERILIGFRDSSIVDLTNYQFEIYVDLCILVSIFVIYPPLIKLFKKIYRCLKNNR